MIAGRGALVLGSVDRALARLAQRLGDLERSREHFDGALALHERVAAPRWCAQTRSALEEIGAAS